ncbi:hypothetical protein EV1_027276 [Malus domestica]
MESLISTIFSLLLFFDSTLGGRYKATKNALENDVSSTIIVDKSGRGNFTTVQQAIDSVPPNNSLWIRILLNPDVYTEKVMIPKEKPYIVLEGDPKFPATIEYGDAGSVIDSPTFKLFADNFVARSIIFKNSYDHLILPDPNGSKTTWAPAILISADKASFHHCSFISLQDTLTDDGGRHYFYDCFIEGAIDFIWGNGQSIYEKCQIFSITDRIGITGFITAQGRKAPNETTGFVLKDCYVNGTGTTFLGRPWRPYSRVLFAYTFMENIITPEGWSPWPPAPVDSVAFSEANCQGPGANLSGRVPWEKKLSDEEVAYFTNPDSFIDQEGWLRSQPN